MIPLGGDPSLSAFYSSFPFARLSLPFCRVSIVVHLRRFDQCASYNVIQCGRKWEDILTMSPDRSRERSIIETPDRDWSLSEGRGFELSQLRHGARIEWFSRLNLRRASNVSRAQGSAVSRCSLSQCLCVYETAKGGKKRRLPASSKEMMSGCVGPTDRPSRSCSGPPA